VDELWEYYGQARRPTLQWIADAIAADYDTFTASKETIRRTMLGKTVPTNGDVADAIFEVLCKRAGIDPNSDRWSDSYDGDSRRHWWRTLWSKALEEEPPPAPAAPARAEGWGSDGGWGERPATSSPGLDDPPF
jgi:hypothetical protein